MRLPALHLLERAQPRVLVVQADHQAQRDLVVLQMVEEAAAEGVVVHRPAGGVHHQAGLGLLRIDLPELLDADRPARGVAAFVELVLRDQLLAEVAARAFREDRVLGMQLHAELEVLGRLAVLADAEVAGGDALHRAIVVVEHFRGREAGEDLDAERLRLLRHPAHDIAEADDVVAFVVERQRHQPVGRAPCAGFREEQDVVGGDRLVQRRAQLLPVREQLIHRTRVHHGARQDVRAGLRALLEHDHRHVLALLGCKLLDADGGGQAAGSGADDQHVVFHRFAWAVLFEDRLRCHGIPWSWTGAILRGLRAKTNDRAIRLERYLQRSSRRQAACHCRGKVMSKLRAIVATEKNRGVCA